MSKLDDRCGQHRLAFSAGGRRLIPEKCDTRCCTVKRQSPSSDFSELLPRPLQYGESMPAAACSHSQSEPDPRQGRTRWRPRPPTKAVMEISRASKAVERVSLLEGMDDPIVTEALAVLDGTPRAADGASAPELAAHRSRRFRSASKSGKRADVMGLRIHEVGDGAGHVEHRGDHPTRPPLCEDSLSPTFGAHSCVRASVIFPSMPELPL